MSNTADCAQHMLFAMCVLKAMGLKVKKPMIMWKDNRDEFILYKNWSISKRTRYVHVY